MTRVPIKIYRWLAVAAGCILTTSTTYLSAEDWPQWRGLNRDAVWNDSGVVDEFPDEGLTVKWSAPVRGGFAGPAVAEICYRLMKVSDRWRAFRARRTTPGVDT